jgi:uncharacterized DUF497 family protein
MVVVPVQISIAERVLEKLTTKHRVTADEMRQCFENRDSGLLEDDREEHRTDPPTQWFIAETNQCRKLKIVFIQRQARGVVRVDVRSAYEPNAEELRLYATYGRGS